MQTGWIPEAAFTAACRALPLVSMDVVVYAPTGRVLLGLRNNAPAQGFWFTPGGRIRKNEAHATALLRIAGGELGRPDVVAHAELMGVWDHFYTDSAFSHEVGTHYVNLPYFVRVQEEFMPPQEAQHAQWCWAPVGCSVEGLQIHPFAQAYLDWVAQRIGTKNHG